MASTNIQTFPGKVGVSNTNPIHTLDIGSNVYIDDTADTKLRIVGNIHASGITVDGTITTIETENLSVKDPIILLASESTGTSDTGIIMKRADGDSNVAIFYDEAVGLKIGHTLSTAEDIHLTVDTSSQLSTSIYGPVTVADSSTQALTVDGGAYVTTDFKVGASKLFVDVSESSVGIGTDAPLATLDVHGTGNVGALTVASDLEVGTANLFVDTTTSNVGIGTTTPAYTLDVHGTANVGALTVASDLEVGTVNLFVDTTTSNVGIGTNAPLATLDVHGTANVGALTVASDLEVGTANLFVDTTTSNVGIGTDAPLATLDVHGTANVGTLSVTSVSGDGSGLTALNGDQVTTGTVAAARIDNLDASKITTGTISRPVTTTGGVTASALYTDRYIFHTGDTNTYMDFPSADTFRIVTAGGERLRVESGGDVGIGTNNPAYKLDVHGTSNVGALTATTVTANKRYLNGGGSQPYQDSMKNSSALSVGWYRIAENGNASDGASNGTRCSARFTIMDYEAGYHSTRTFYAGGTFGNKPFIHLLTNTSYGSDGMISKVRVVEASVYEGLAVEIYVDTTSAANRIRVVMDDNYQSNGFELVSFESVVADHSGMNEYEIDLNTTFWGAFIDTPSKNICMLENGNVGIGITNPSNKLHVNGQAYFDRSRLTSDAGYFGTIPLGNDLYMTYGYGAMAAAGGALTVYYHDSFTFDTVYNFQLTIHDPGRGYGTLLSGAGLGGLYTNRIYMYIKYNGSPSGNTNVYYWVIGKKT